MNQELKTNQLFEEISYQKEREQNFILERQTWNKRENYKRPKKQSKTSKELKYKPKVASEKQKKVSHPLNKEKWY